jgi:hypothetical protein
MHFPFFELGCFVLSIFSHPFTTALGLGELFILYILGIVQKKTSLAIIIGTPFRLFNPGFFL